LDLILTIGHGHSLGPRGELFLRPGQWHRLLPTTVPDMATSAGGFNAGVYLVRNSPKTRAFYRSLFVLPFLCDQTELMAQLYHLPKGKAKKEGNTNENVKGADAGADTDADDNTEEELGLQREVSIEPHNVARFSPHGLAVRFLPPRCLNCNPHSSAPWARYMHGDFIAHLWGFTPVEEKTRWVHTYCALAEGITLRGTRSDRPLQSKQSMMLVDNDDVHFYSPQCDPFLALQGLMICAIVASALFCFWRRGCKIVHSRSYQDGEEKKKEATKCGLVGPTTGEDNHGLSRNGLGGHTTIGGASIETSRRNYRSIPMSEEDDV